MTIEHKIKHLEMIQSVISRMASNSFLLKGWSVTIIAALFALAEKDSNRAFAYLAIFPAVTFWGLDALYYYKERQFRDLYSLVRSAIESPDTAQVPCFSMDTNLVNGGFRYWFKALFSRSVFYFHLVILIVFFLVMVFTNTFSQPGSVVP